MLDTSEETIAMYIGNWTKKKWRIMFYSQTDRGDETPDQPI